MNDQLAVYGHHELRIARWAGDCPRVFHDGALRPAADVVLDGYGLTDIVPAPKLMALPLGWWADALYTPDEGPPVRESYPLLAVEVHAGGWGRGLVLNGDGICFLDSTPSRTWEFLGYRLGEPGPYCAHGER